MLSPCTKSTTTSQLFTATYVALNAKNHLGTAGLIGRGQASDKRSLARQRRPPTAPTLDAPFRTVYPEVRVCVTSADLVRPAEFVHAICPVPME